MGGEPRLPLLPESLLDSVGREALGPWGFPSFHSNQTHSAKPKGGDSNSHRYGWAWTSLLDDSRTMPEANSLPTDRVFASKLVNWRNL